MRRRFKPYVMLIQMPVFSKFTPFRAFSIKSIEFCTFSSLSNNFGQNPSNFGHFPAKYFGQSPRNPVSYDRIQQKTFRTHSGTKFRTNSACPPPRRSLPPGRRRDLPRATLRAYDTKRARASRGRTVVTDAARQRGAGQINGPC